MAAARVAAAPVAAAAPVGPVVAGAWWAAPCLPVVSKPKTSSNWRTRTLEGSSMGDVIRPGNSETRFTILQFEVAK